jgi:environmental stress-induced protein Ves
MAWKNGLGVTREVAIDPPETAMSEAAFRWRLSIADVAQSGPFSTFPGVDRTIMVIKGNGMVLSVAGRPPQRIDRCFAPYEFPGDAATECELIDGPIQDFNLMVNRALLSARTEVRKLSQGEDIPLIGGFCILYLLAGDAQLRLGASEERGSAGDTFLLYPRRDLATLQLAPRHAVDVALISLHESG